MSKATMPEPAAVVVSGVMRHLKQSNEGDALITTDQAEAYKDAKAREALAWQPIETAPRDGSHVLLRSRSGRMADGFWGVRYGVWSWPYVMTEPAYWMPLPPPPQHDNE